MRAKPLKILAALTLALAILATIAYANSFLFLYKYSEACGRYSKVWAAVWGLAELDAKGYMAGRLYGVDGIGGGYITEGFIVVRRVIIDPTPYGEFAYKITEAYLWDRVLDARAIASIGAVKGACGPYYPT